MLLTPPYHSDLQPIELVWAMVKGGVGRQYNNETTLELVYQRLLKEFDRLLVSGHDAVDGMIKKCASISWKFYQEMDEDDIDDGDDDEAIAVDDDEAVDYDEEDEDGNWDEGFVEGNEIEIEQI